MTFYRRVPKVLELKLTLWASARDRASSRESVGRPNERPVAPLRELGGNECRFQRLCRRNSGSHYICFSKRENLQAPETAAALRRRTQDRRAYFVAVLALAWPDGRLEVFRGEAHGSLIWPPRGRHGFGYDPMFLPEGSTLTFGELDPPQKHAISHRAQAFRKLVAACFAPVAP